MRSLGRRISVFFNIIVTPAFFQLFSIIYFSSFIVNKLNNSVSQSDWVGLSALEKNDGNKKLCHFKFSEFVIRC